MASEKVVNYTAEQTAQMLEMYGQGVAVEMVAEAMGRSARSVIAKLSREGVYQSKAKAKAGTRVTKADLVRKIEAAVGAEAGTLESLEKASHDALEMVARQFE